MLKFFEKVVAKINRPSYINGTTLKSVWHKAKIMNKIKIKTINVAVSLTRFCKKGKFDLAKNISNFLQNGKNKKAITPPIMKGVSISKILEINFRIIPTLPIT